MIKRIRTSFATLTAVWLMAVSLSAQAVPTAITGDIEFILGGYNPVSDTGGTTVGIDFDPNMFMVSSATGSFAGTSGIGNIADFMFDLPGGSIDDFWAVGDFNFRLDSVSVSTNTSEFLSLTGEGLISGVGFADTYGSWQLEGTSTGGIFGWTSRTEAASVPEPMTSLLLATGFILTAVGKRLGRRKL